MVEWTSEVVIKRCFSAATALMWICIGLMLYDGARFAGFDWKIITGKRARRWPQIPYLFAKVCYWTYIITNLIFVLTLKEINCNGFLQSIEMQMGWVTVSSSMLLAFRAVCVYSGTARKMVSASLTIFLLGVLVAWMVGVPDTVAMWVPNGGDPWTEGACGFKSISSKYAIKYVVTIAFDLFVLILTVVGVLKMNGGSRIGTVLVEQGILYFVATFIINALVTGLTLANLNPVMSLIGAIPAATVCVMCSTRLYVELAREAHPKAGGVSTSQITSAGTHKFSRFFRRGGTSSAHTATNGSTQMYNVKPLKYNEMSKSLESASAEDIEAQTTRSRGNTVINVVESQIITKEPMPSYLDGPGFASVPEDVTETDEAATSVSDHPYSRNNVKGHFPRLSKS